MILLWSFNFIIADIAFDLMSPLPFSLYRFLIASISFLLIDIYHKNKTKNFKVEKSNVKKLSQNDWLLIIIASFIGQSFYFFTLYGAIDLIGPSLPALFVCLLSPLVITVLALLFFGEKLNQFKVIGFIIATIGAFFLVTGGDISVFSLSSPNYLGYLFALLTPIQWAIYSTITKKLSKKFSMIKILQYTTFLGMIELFIFVLLNGEWMIFLQFFANPIIITCALYTGLICHVIGYYIWQHSQQQIDSSKVASFLYIEPFITLIFSLLLQRQEIIGLLNIIGGLIVLGAVLIINYRSKQVDITPPEE